MARDVQRTVLKPGLCRQAELGPYAFVFGTPEGEFQDSSRLLRNHCSWIRP